MGADMLVSYIYFKQGVDLESIKKKMLEKADEPVVLAEMLGRPEAPQFQVPYTTLQFRQENDEDEKPKTFEELTKEFKETINETFNSLYYRDVTNFDFMGYTIYLTGGLSWGDDPTETFSVFDRFWKMPELITDIHE
jgi:hypothetical protein